MSQLTFSLRFRLQWAYEDHKCSVWQERVLLFSYVEGLRELPGIAWKGETAAFIHKSLRHELRRTFFRGAWLPASASPSMEWLRGLRKPRKSLMSERIISVYESSSDFPQIPFHSGKKWIFSAKEEKKTFNATWQAKHPVWSERLQHTLRIELMLCVLPVLPSSLSLDNECLVWLMAYCTKEVTRVLISASYGGKMHQFLWFTILIWGCELRHKCH